MTATTTLDMRARFQALPGSGVTLSRPLLQHGCHHIKCHTRLQTTLALHPSQPVIHPYGTCTPTHHHHIAVAAAAPVGSYASSQAQNNTAYLTSLLSRVAAGGHSPDPDWYDTFFASTAASLPFLAAGQLEVLLTGLGKLQVVQSVPAANHVMRCSSQAPASTKIPTDWLAAFLDASERCIEELTPAQVVSLLRSCALLDIIPPISWISAALQRVGR